MSTENWKPVVGFEGIYEVSDLGRVRSLDRTSPRRSKAGKSFRVFQKGRLLSLGYINSGYLQVHFYKEGKVTADLLHAVVLKAFVGPRPEGAEGMHLNNNKHDCRLDNLKWGTKAENEQHKVQSGRSLRGERSVGAKLSEKDVIAIRQRVGEPQEKLAEEFGCTFSNISAIQLRKSWRHV